MSSLSLFVFHINANLFIITMTTDDQKMNEDTLFSGQLNIEQIMLKIQKSNLHLYKDYIYILEHLNLQAEIQMKSQSSQRTSPIPQFRNIKADQNSSLQKNKQILILYTLGQKYNNTFNFFFAKPTAEIVFNQTYSQSTLSFKDSIVYAESNQYMKRVYHMKNSANRNEIYDRINMLANFYANAVLLRYEYPNMIISGTKNIFLKRLKRMKKMIAADCSSQQDEQEEEMSEDQDGSANSRNQFSSSGFLSSIRTQDLSSSSIIDKQKHQQQRQQQSLKRDQKIRNLKQMILGRKSVQSNQQDDFLNGEYICYESSNKKPYNKGFTSFERSFDQDTHDIYNNNMAMGADAFKNVKGKKKGQKRISQGSESSEQNNKVFQMVDTIYRPQNNPSNNYNTINDVITLRDIKLGSQLMNNQSILVNEQSKDIGIESKNNSNKNIGLSVLPGGSKNRLQQRQINNLIYDIDDIDYQSAVILYKKAQSRRFGGQTQQLIINLNLNDNVDNKMYRKYQQLQNVNNTKTRQYYSNNNRKKYYQTNNNNNNNNNNEQISSPKYSTNPNMRKSNINTYLQQQQQPSSSNNPNLHPNSPNTIYSSQYQQRSNNTMKKSNIVITPIISQSSTQTINNQNINSRGNSNNYNYNNMMKKNKYNNNNNNNYDNDNDNAASASTSERFINANNNNNGRMRYSNMFLTNNQTSSINTPNNNNKYRNTINSPNNGNMKYSNVFEQRYHQRQLHDQYQYQHPYQHDDQQSEQYYQHQDYQYQHQPHFYQNKNQYTSGNARNIRSVTIATNKQQYQQEQKYHPRYQHQPYMRMYDDFQYNYDHPSEQQSNHNEIISHHNHINQQQFYDGRQTERLTKTTDHRKNQYQASNAKSINNNLGKMQNNLRKQRLFTTPSNPHTNIGTQNDGNNLLQLHQFQLQDTNGNYYEMNNAIRAQKKQIIRDKAVALLYKVKSAQKFTHNNNKKFDNPYPHPKQYQHEDIRIPRAYY